MLKKNSWFSIFEKKSKSISLKLVIPIQAKVYTITETNFNDVSINEYISDAYISESQPVMQHSMTLFKLISKMEN